MFEFGNKKKNKVLIWIVVAILVLCMVVPTAYQLLAAIFA